MMPAKLATVGVLKIKEFWYKGYDVIFSVYDATKRFLLTYLFISQTQFKFTNISIQI